MMIYLKPFDGVEHKLLLKKWLWKPHVQAGWGDPQENLASVLSAESKAEFFLIEYANQPVGFIQWQWISNDDLKDTGLTFDDELTADVDLFIGEEHCLGKGIGTAALRLMMRWLTDNTAANRVTLFTKNDNKAALRAYQKCGFIPLVEFDDEDIGWAIGLVAELERK